MKPKIKAAPWGAAIATLELTASKLQNERGMGDRMNELLAAANVLKGLGRYPHAVKVRIEGLDHEIKNASGELRARLEWQRSCLKSLQAECNAPPPIDGGQRP